jgi:hypothetical protein
MRISKTRGALIGLAVLGIGSGLAYAAGMWSTLPIVGNPSFCASNVSGVGLPASQGPFGIVPGSTQGNSSGICGQTVPAGPPTLTGNELIPADTGGQSVGPTGAAPATVTIPSPLLFNRVNWLVGSDYGQSLWQRGTTPVNAGTPAGNALYTADGWYVYTTGTQQVTVSKQTGSTDQPPASLASMRVQRPSTQAGVAPICVGQLIPDDSSQSFIGRTAVFSIDAIAGALFSPNQDAVSMIIAYHSAADATAAANGQGTNTATFASSAGATQNITNYTEAVNTLVPLGTAWNTRYSVAAVIPALIPGTSTATTGVGVKICFTPVGTAGATDWFEFGKAQLESRAGGAVGPSPYVPNLLSAEWAYEQARYFQVNEGVGGTPIVGYGMVNGTNNELIGINFPVTMRITPVTSPITAGGFRLDIAGTLTATGTIGAPANGNTKQIGELNTTAVATSGQATWLTGGQLGTGVLGFSAEP